jgi:hypothetical protein
MPGDCLVMIPPILEVYVLWHPRDVQGKQVASWLLDHFHGGAYAGLLGGTVEVYERSTGWAHAGGPPRPLPFMAAMPEGMMVPTATTVVAVLGTHLARAVEESAEWRQYLAEMLGAATGSVGVYPLRLDPEALSGTTIGRMFTGQALDSASATDSSTLVRELAQAVAQLIGDPLGSRLQVFISHTRRQSPGEDQGQVDDLITQVRSAIGSTRLQAFFDEADIQPGEDWHARLEHEAARSGLLIIRTDRYASRSWCQREVLCAKRAEMPVVALIALTSGEERGSFLMDHVPTVPVDHGNGERVRSSIEAALNQLVDEALKRALWRLQRPVLERLGFNWLPVHAPEPVTIIPWILERAASRSDARMVIVHPDPPLGPEEEKVIKEILALGGIDEQVDVLTPRTLASRGGRVAIS